MAYIGKEFKFEKEENYSDFIQALGISPDEKQNFLNYRPNIKLVKNGDSYTMSFINSGKTNDVTFIPGKEFKEVLNGVEAQSVYTVDGDTFTQFQDLGPRGKITVKRIFSANQLVMELSASSWDGVARRYYTA